ncbi:MAG: alpha/beta fold hydrolase [Chloroflexi bacterium]|nr:alpha/beta fold hydrolase [Chloroflexota bacterium]
MTRSRPAALPLDLAYDAQGRGPAVVFLHGFAGGRGQWHTYLPLVAAAGFRAYAVDLPGHGQSPPLTTRPASALAWAETVHAWIDARIPPPVHLVGHSLGGYLALAYAARAASRVASLTLFAPLTAGQAIRWPARLWVRVGNLAPWLPERWPPGVATLLRVAYWFYPDAWHMRPSQRARRVAEVAGMSPRAVWALGRVPDIRPRVAGLPVRTWVVGGARDRVLDPASYTVLGELLPHSRVWLLPRAGHIPHLTAAETLQQALVRWLQGHDPAASPHAARTSAGNTSPAGPRST